MKRIAIFFCLLCSTLSFSQIKEEKLEEVKIEIKRKGIKKSLNVTANTVTVTDKELLKAACCNLAESFETNPTIDVSFSDAVSGSKQIKMLGLTSPYILISEENIPSVRGASQVYGLSFTPGTWVESIQITKGAGSVINGYESISGHINTELIKPIKDIPFFVNIYGSTDSRFEINTHFNKKISDYWSTSLFVHGNTRVAKNDMNHDGFLDNPLGKQINFTNRWQYANPESNWVSFLNLKYMKDEKQSGELKFNPQTDKLTTKYWGSEINTERLDFSSKVGFVFKDMPYQSIGFQNAVSVHNQESYFGLRQYNIKQQSVYSNLIFNSIINNTMHKFSTGLNFTLDKYDEYFNSLALGRIDNSVGGFFEYTYDDGYKFSLIAGNRIDYHNRLGVFYTPRLHLKYKPTEKSVIRFSAGRGKRAANIFAENQNLFASSRNFLILDSNGKVYGLNPEIAWNYGISYTHKFYIFGKPADTSVDFYRTDFQNQVVVDVMNSPQEVLFYDLKGKSYANSLQIDFNYEIFRHLNFRTAYKYYDIITDYLSGEFQKPLQAKHRFFANLEAGTHVNDGGSQWKLDYTFNWLSKQQLLTTFGNPTEDRLPEFSNPFSVMNTQVTRVFSSEFEVYAGCENIGNVKQEKAILGSQSPFGPTFDATINYGPIFGRMFYAGLRFKIK